MNKRTKKIFKDNKLRTKKQNWKPLIYACGGFAIFLLFWVAVINSGGDDLEQSTIEGIEKGKQSIQELKDEVYTQEVVEEVYEGHDDTQGTSLSGLPGVGSDVGDFLTNIAPGVGAFIIIIALFGGVAAIVYAIVGVVKNKLE